jgi:hypothetical protein
MSGEKNERVEDPRSSLSGVSGLVLYVTQQRESYPSFSVGKFLFKTFYCLFKRLDLLHVRATVRFINWIPIYSIYSYMR